MRNNLTLFSSLAVVNPNGEVRAYRIAREHAPVSDNIGELLAREIERVQLEPLDQIEPLRNPGLE
jgi:hypothetical protein